MASGKFETFSQLLLNRLLAASPWIIPGTFFPALFTVSPSVSSLGTEATGGGYTRVTVVSGAGNWPPIGGATTTIANGAAFTFPIAAVDWSAGANMVAAGLWDSLAAGVLYWWGAVAVSQSVLSGNTARFPIGALTVQEL
jgi:hypothetical protein